MYQLEYAQEATKRGCTVVGVCSADCVVLAAWKPSPSSNRALPAKTIWTVDSHVGIAASGLRSDVQHVSDHAFKWCSEHHYIFGTPMSCPMLARRLGDLVHSCTTRGGTRPLAVDMLVAGVDNHAGPTLHQVQPTGAIQRYKAIAVGANAAAANANLIATSQSIRVRDNPESESCLPPADDVVPLSIAPSGVTVEANKDRMGQGVEAHELDGSRRMNIGEERQSFDHGTGKSSASSGSEGRTIQCRVETPRQCVALKRAISALHRAGNPEGVEVSTRVRASEMTAVVYSKNWAGHGQLYIGKEGTGYGEELDGTEGGYTAGRICSTRELQSLLQEVEVEWEEELAIGARGESGLSGECLNKKSNEDNEGPGEGK
ncbi:unnamed protein product [Discosporangium mesarthrocarpum]